MSLIFHKPLSLVKHFDFKQWKQNQFKYRVQENKQAVKANIRRCVSIFSFVSTLHLFNASC